MDFCSLIRTFAFVMTQRLHHIIISLASNINHEANLEAARTHLNQLCEGTTALGPELLSEVLKELEKRQGRTHNEDGIVTLDLDLMQYDDDRYHLRDWERSYIKDLINEL